MPEAKLTNVQKIAFFSQENPAIVVTSLQPKERPVMSMRQRRIAEFCSTEASRQRRKEMRHRERLSRRANRKRATLVTCTAPTAPCGTWDPSKQDGVTVLFPPRDLLYSDSEVAILSAHSSSRLVDFPTEENPPLRPHGRVRAYDGKDGIGDRYHNKPPAGFVPSNDLSAYEEQTYRQVWHSLWEHQVGGDSVESSKSVVTEQENVGEIKTASACNIWTPGNTRMKLRKGVLPPTAHYTRMPRRSKNVNRSCARTARHRAHTRAAHRTPSPIAERDDIGGPESECTKGRRFERVNKNRQPGIPRVVVTSASRPTTAVSPERKSEGAGPVHPLGARPDTKLRAGEKFVNRLTQSPKNFNRPRFSAPARVNRAPLELLFEEMNARRGLVRNTRNSVKSRSPQFKFAFAQNPALSWNKRPVRFNMSERHRSSTMRNGKRHMYNQPSSGTFYPDMRQSADRFTEQRKVNPANRLIQNNFYGHPRVARVSSSKSSPFDKNTDNNINSKGIKTSVPASNNGPLRQNDLAMPLDLMYGGRVRSQTAYRFSHLHVPDVLISPPPNRHRESVSGATGETAVPVFNNQCTPAIRYAPQYYAGQLETFNPPDIVEGYSTPAPLPILQPNVPLRSFMPSVDFSRIEPPPKPPETLSFIKEIDETTSRSASVSVVRPSRSYSKHFRTTVSVGAQVPQDITPKMPVSYKHSETEGTDDVSLTNSSRVISPRIFKSEKIAMGKERIQGDVKVVLNGRDTPGDAAAIISVQGENDKNENLLSTVQSKRSEPKFKHRNLNPRTTSSAKLSTVTEGSNEAQAEISMIPIDADLTVQDTKDVQVKPYTAAEFCEHLEDHKDLAILPRFRGRTTDQTYQQDAGAPEDSSFSAGYFRRISDLGTTYTDSTACPLTNTNQPLAKKMSETSTIFEDSGASDMLDDARSSLAREVALQSKLHEGNFKEHRNVLLRNVSIQVPAVHDHFVGTKPYLEAISTMRTSLSVCLMSTVVDVPPIIKKTETVGTSTEKLKTAEEGNTADQNSLKKMTADKECSTTGLKADKSVDPIVICDADSPTVIHISGHQLNQIKPFLKFHSSQFANVYTIAAVHSISVRAEKSNVNNEKRKDKQWDDVPIIREREQPGRASKQQPHSRRVSFRPFKKDQAKLSEQRISGPSTFQSSGFDVEPRLSKETLPPSDLKIGKSKTDGLLPKDGGGNVLESKLLDENAYRDDVIALGRKPGYVRQKESTVRKGILKSSKTAEPPDIPDSLVDYGLRQIIAPISLGGYAGNRTDYEAPTTAKTHNSALNDEDKPTEDASRIRSTKNTFSSRKKIKHSKSLASLIALERKNIAERMKFEEAQWDQICIDHEDKPFIVSPDSDWEYSGKDSEPNVFEGAKLSNTTKQVPTICLTRAESDEVCGNVDDLNDTPTDIFGTSSGRSSKKLKDFTVGIPPKELDPRNDTPKSLNDTPARLKEIERPELYTETKFLEARLKEASDIEIDTNLKRLDPLGARSEKVADPDNKTDFKPSDADFKPSSAVGFYLDKGTDVESDCYLKQMDHPGVHLQEASDTAIGTGLKQSGSNKLRDVAIDAPSPLLNNFVGNIRRKQVKDSAVDCSKDLFESGNNDRVKVVDKHTSSLHSGLPLENIALTETVPPSVGCVFTAMRRYMSKHRRPGWSYENFDDNGFCYERYPGFCSHGIPARNGHLDIPVDESSEQDSSSVEIVEEESDPFCCRCTESNTFWENLEGCCLEDYSTCISESEGTLTTDKSEPKSCVQEVIFDDSCSKSCPRTKLLWQRVLKRTPKQSPSTSRKSDDSPKNISNAMSSMNYVVGLCRPGRDASRSSLRLCSRCDEEKTSENSVKIEQTRPKRRPTIVHEAPMFISSGTRPSKPEEVRYVKYRLPGHSMCKESQGRRKVHECARNSLFDCDDCTCECCDQSGTRQRIPCWRYKRVPPQDSDIFLVVDDDRHVDPHCRRTRKSCSHRTCR